MPSCVEHTASTPTPANLYVTAVAAAAPPPASALKPLLLILAAGVVLRLLLWSWFQGEPLYIVDEQDYNLLAINLVEHNEFAFTPGTPTALRPPLYPLLVSAIYRVCGLESFQAVRLVQAGLSLLTAVLLFGLGRRVHSVSAGLWLAGLFTFYPSFLGQVNLVLTETLFTLLLVASCYALVVFYQTDRLRWIALAGILLGLGALTRSVLWMAPPLLAGFVFLTWRAAWLRRGAAALCLVAGFAAAVAPWSLRNSNLFGTFVAVDVMGGRNFMMGNYEHTPLYRSWDAISITGDQAWDSVLRRTTPAAVGANQAQVDELAMRHGVNFIVSNPGLSAQRTAIRFFDFWGLERELVAGAQQGFWGGLPTPAIVALGLLIVGVYVTLLFLGIYGVLLTPLPDRRLHWLLVCVVVYVCGIHSLVFAHSRYHLPIIPIVLLFAAVAIVHRRAIWSQRKTWTFGVATAACVLFMAGWSWNFIAGDAAKLLSLLGAS